MKIKGLKQIFLSDRLMLGACLLSVLCGIGSAAVLAGAKALTLLELFQTAVKALMVLVLCRAFTRCRWDAAWGIMGGVLFCVLYQESFVVLGKLWSGTADFDAYLIMGVEGSLYLASQTMSMMTTAIITVNHFIISYSSGGNRGNVMLGQLTIVFKVILYLMLMAVNVFLDLSAPVQLACGLQYLGDLAIIIGLVCV
ncbi:MAG: hypothetical protein Q4C54_01970 [Clostridia bacterium]|nr:hypothetical protein [Clostridia bacterium]